ncbi:MAG: hypothetical protein WCO65_01320 [bacterium]
MHLFLHPTEEQENDIEHGSLEPQHVEYVTSAIRELGKHISELSRQEIAE